MASETTQQIPVVAQPGQQQSELDRQNVDLGYASTPHDDTYTNHEQQRNNNNNNGPQKVKKSGLFGTSSNLINTIVGAGIIGIPYAFRMSGWLAGLAMLAFVGFLTDKSLRIMIDLANFHPQLSKRHVTSFERLAWFPFGKWGRWFVLLNMFIMAYGAMVAYLLIIKDTVPTLLGVPQAPNDGGMREVILILTSASIMLPLSMQRDMATLAITSFLSVSADVVLVIFIVVFSPVEESIEEAGGIGPILEEDSIRPTLFIGLGVLSTAMACQHSAFIVSGSLHQLTRPRWACVTGSSIGLATLLCAILGSAGYLGFLDETAGDVLNNFPAGGVFANTARALLAVTMFFTYPMESFVGRHVLSAFLYKGDMENMDGTDDIVPITGCIPESAYGCFNRRVRLTLCLYIVSLIPALIFDDLGPVLSITGSIGGSCIAYITPGMVYLGINGRHFIHFCKGMMSRGRQSHDGIVMVPRGSVGGGGEIELPVAGDATQTMASDSNGSNGASGAAIGNGHVDLPLEGEHRVMEAGNDEISGCKPIWWYLLGFPVWYAVARTGMRTMEIKLAATEGEEDEFQSINSDDDDSGGDAATSGDSNKDTLPPPRGIDYFIAIMMITFGIIAAAAGLVTNIYVQIYGFQVAE